MYTKCVYMYVYMLMVEYTLGFWLCDMVIGDWNENGPQLGSGIYKFDLLNFLSSKPMFCHF